MPDYSGLWDGQNAESYAIQVNRAPQLRQIARLLKRRTSRDIQEILRTDAVENQSGATALRTYKRVVSVADPGNSVVNGGARTFETVTKVNTATAAATAALATPAVDHNVAPSTYPADLSGNGGGGKLTAEYVL